MPLRRPQPSDGIPRRQAPLTPAQRRQAADAAGALLELLAAPGDLPRGVVVAWGVELLLLIEPPEDEDPTSRTLRLEAALRPRPEPPEGP